MHQPMAFLAGIIYCKIAKSQLKKQISKLTVLRVRGAQKTACTPA